MSVKEIEPRREAMKSTERRPLAPVEARRAATSAVSGRAARHSSKLEKTTCARVVRQRRPEPPGGVCRISRPMKTIEERAAPFWDTAKRTPIQR